MFVKSEQLGFYFNEGTQCSLYLIYTEYLQMACSVIPVENVGQRRLGEAWWGEGWAAHLVCAEEGQGDGCGFYFSFRRKKQQASNLGLGRGWAGGSFPGSSVVEKLPANVGDVGLIPGSGRCPGKENGSPLQCSCLENPMDRRPWWATVRGSQRVKRDWTTEQQRAVSSEALTWYLTVGMWTQSTPWTRLSF